MKNRLTKTLCLILSLAMLVAMAAACQQEGPIDEPTPVPETTPAPADMGSTDDGVSAAPVESILTVAYNGEMNGDFIDGFGNNAYDLSIKTLLHGHGGTFELDYFDNYVFNETFFAGYTDSEDADGNVTYTFTLKEGLTWSDGSEITAEDYVTTILWTASPQWRDAGGATSGNGYGLLGYADYNRGYKQVLDADGSPEMEELLDADGNVVMQDVLDEEGEVVGEVPVMVEVKGDAVDAFAGVKLLGTYEFSLTIDAEELPYFYEFTYVSYGPMPKHVYAPDISISSDDNGAKFDGDISADCERIASTERFAPSVVVGPYKFVSFENQICTLVINENFNGTFDGKFPTIETVVQMTVPEETDVDMLIAGQIDLLPEMIEGEKINRVKADPNLKTSDHLRNGYGVLNMVNNWGPTADRNVRWAIACLVDRNQLIEQVLEGYGGLVDGPFGQAQWMYQELRAELQANLIPISLNIEKANEYLDESEWKFEADGVTPFDASKATADGSYMRHNAAGEMLVIEHAAANAQVGNILEIEFSKNTPLAGMQYNFHNPDFDVILNELYEGILLDDADRTYSTFSMGLGFGRPFDPFYDEHSQWIMPYYNSTGINDPELDEHIMAMRNTEPGDNETYLQHWYDYVLRWNWLLPNIPLYSNQYVNLFSGKLDDCPTTPFASWYVVICDINIVG